MKHCRSQEGFALVAVLLMLSVLVALLGAYSTVTRSELLSNRESTNSARGFYAAEAGLNLRAEAVRLDFVGYNRPAGTSPTGDDACLVSGNMGSGDFACEVFNIGGRQAVTYVAEQPGNPLILTIPPGELYQHLNAQEYRYTSFSRARRQEREEAVLELHFKSRLVPLFQFAAFYNKDLEILPGAAMNLAGPVHTNGDLYLNTEASLDVRGQVSVAGDLYRGRKNSNVCLSNPVRIYNPTTGVSLVPSCSSRQLVNPNSLGPWNGMIRVGVDTVTVPEPEVLDPTSGRVYWDHADIRLVLNLNSSNNVVTTHSARGIEVRNSNDTVNSAAQAILDACSGTISGRVVGTTNSMYNNREGEYIRMLELDMQGLLNCIHNNDLLGGSFNLDDDTDGGLVFYLTVKGPDSNAAANNYGIRVQNGAALRSSTSGAPSILGLTVVSDQAVYLKGNYNSTNKKPAAVLCDSFNVLSGNWSDSNSTSSISSRTPSDTTQNLAILSGTDSTGNIEGAGGQGGAYNGGLENYPRFHENWSGRTYTYLGSFVSLNKPRHVNGAWVYGNPQYNAPNRNWTYDTSFNNAANLPPITPRFVYLRQELFVRDFELD